MAVRTINFLPQIFRSDTNTKFLNATLDQLVSKPDLRKVNGYIGRTFAPTFKSTDNYQPEPSAIRQDYQLEPSIVVKNKQGTTEFFSSYIDLVQQIKHYGGVTVDPSRMFQSETYSFDGLIDFDKLVNFNQYYWLPNGPDAIEVYGSSIEKTKTFTVTRNPDTGSYKFTGTGQTQNPILHLANGGTYKFIVNQPGFPFWIQSDAGASGVRQSQPNISTRDVYGVENNGIDVGEITFNVPQTNAQDFYLRMPLVDNVDFATTLRYSDIQNINVGDLINLYDGFDGIADGLLNKKLIFINDDTDDAFWTAKGRYDIVNYESSDARILSDAASKGSSTIVVGQSANNSNLSVGMYVSSGQSMAPNTVVKAISGSTVTLSSPLVKDIAKGTEISFSTVNYDTQGTVPVEQRRGIWQIKIITTDNLQIVNLVPITTVSANQKVYVKSGVKYAQYSYYINSDSGLYTRVPHITAPLPVLFYQDGVVDVMQGEFSITELTGTQIDIENKLLGKKTYISPNGVEFTNGMKIRFGGGIIPDSYIGNEYYVEGVGTSIKLLLIDNFISPEGFDRTQDYITINRAAQNLNPWTRSNRWFHIDVLKITANYNNVPVLLDQLQRATRPIIEFDPDIQLFNFGRVAKAPIDILDFTITDAFNQVELHQTITLPGGIKLKSGQRIVFANDIDPNVRNKIYTVNYFENTTDGTFVINLAPSGDTEVLPYNNLIPFLGAVTSSGIIKNTEYYYDGANWLPCQTKTSLNQAPLFDAVDENRNSLADNTIYPGTTFAGTKVFSYRQGTGVNDIILGFPLSYRSFNQIGDIQFENNFDSDTFTYSSNTVNIDTIGLLCINNSLTDYSLRNMWIKNIEDSQQYQIIGKVYNGINNFFQYDIDPINENSTVPHFRVYRNNKILAADLYSRVTIGAKKFVKVIDPNMTKGDRIDIRILSDSVSGLGYYEIPKNLDLNTENKNFTSLTLGQMRTHLSTMAENTNRITGNILGSSNLRDVPIKQQGGSIIQHASPVLYSELFLVDPKVNFIKGIELARHEYSKIKNKFIELSTKLDGVDPYDIPATTDLIISNINQVKNKSFPWYYSDMVPYGTVQNTITYTVLDTEIRDYEISGIFKDTELSNQAVLVYVNKHILVRDRDFVYDQTKAGVTINTSYTLEVGDIITINEYSSTDGNYIPETPTKLGLYPKFVPEKFVDDRYQTPITVIGGHDGSITPAFGDFRDDLLLEFETRIYNNIKINYETNIFDIYNFFPGKFRKYDYDITEWTRLLTRSFLKWVGGNRVDFTSNLYFDYANPFTWNYKKFIDTIDGEKLQGTWRGIYNYFYDTDRPHTAPWEMLGFAKKPDWWEDRYGPAPYTGGNRVLWDDLEAGYIHSGDRAGIDERFTRPGLSKIIPVDDHGLLRSPEKFATAGFNGNDASSSYSVGDWGPVETAWRHSSDYPFAIQQALATGFPAFYFGTLMNVGDYYRHASTGQFVTSSNLQRVSTGIIKLNGDTTSGTPVRAAGYINWVSDYLQNNGIDPITTIQEYLNQVTVQLAYKTAGFTDPSMMEVIAEQSSATSTNQGVVIPKENYSIELYKSTPILTIVYSAVIVEKSENGYTISGYDLDNPYFTIIPSVANNNAYNIKVGQDVAIIYKDYQKYKVNIPYGFEFNNKQQIVDFLVGYERYLKGQGVKFSEYDTDLQDQRNFKLSAKEFLAWSQQGWDIGNILVLSPILNTLEINSSQGIIDGIQNRPGASRILDVNFSFIKSSQFTVTREENKFTLSTNYFQTIALASLDVVEYEHIMIFDNATVFNDIIYKPELGNRQYRLKLIGQKTGNWTGQLNPGGFIYNSTKVDEWMPGIDYRKGSLVSYKTLYYAALQDIVAATAFDPALWRQVAQGEIKTGLLPNFTYNAGKFKDFFDLDNPSQEGGFDSFSNRLIGFQERQYMTDFGIDAATQAKFYQGFIKEKGTLNAVNAFTAAGFNEVTSKITTYEDWGIRVGEYGALDNNKFVEVVLDENHFTGDPSTFTLMPDTLSILANSQQVEKVINISPNQLYRRSLNYNSNIYLNRDQYSIYEDDVRTAGYVNNNDVDATIFDLVNYNQLNSYLTDMEVGYKIWCAKDFNKDWNVFRVSETGANAIELAYDIDNTGTLTTDKSHGLGYGDIVIIKGFDVRIDGVFQVYSVISNTKVSLVITSIASILKSLQIISSTGTLYKLTSLRVADAIDLSSVAPLHDWMSGDKFWVDKDSNTGKWAVYNKSTPWTANVSDANQDMVMAANSYMSGSGFGTITTISDSGTFAAAGMPTFTDINGVLGSGRVMAFVANAASGYRYQTVANIAPTQQNISGFGASLESSGNILYVGAPGDGTTQSGNVFVYTFDGVNQFSLTQQIRSHWGSNIGDQFGYSITASEDTRWLFVGAPYKGNVEVYAKTGSSYDYVTTISGVVSSNIGYTVVTTTDASQTIIGAPYETVNGVLSAGAVYVYDRSIETFITGVSIIYTTENPISTATVRVLLNGSDITANCAFGTNTVTLLDGFPTLGSTLVVETNKFNLIRKITSDMPKSGAAFGTTTHISGNDADIYISSPGFSEPGYYSGIVYRYVNTGAAYGTVSSTNYLATVAVGDTMRINGMLVTFTANAVGSTVGNLMSIAADINSTAIPGVSAAVTDFSVLTLTSNISIPYQKLLLTPGSTGTALANIGFDVYDEAQTIRHPSTDRVDQFGIHVTSSYDSSKLIISATGGTTYNSFILDNGLTVFDFNSTEFLDDIPGSGSVYVYGLVGGHFAGSAADQYVLVQRLQNNNLETQDQFGSSLALSNNTLLVGASGDNGRKFVEDPNSGKLTAVPDTGTYYVYHNFSGNIGWDVIRSEEPKVDIDSITKFYIYDTVNNKILTHLDHIDPAKGRVLGTADEDIDYRTPYDPAIYNNATDAGPDVSISSDIQWGSAQVGKIWWNLDVVRYIDYEQGSLTYRASNWGATFPGSDIAVYEWIESDVAPSQFTGDGTPLYADDTAYCIQGYVDPVTKIVRTKYYFWVRGKNLINQSSTKNNSAAQIENIIAYPRSQGIPYAAAIRSDTISLYGVNEYISGNNRILHVDYDTIRNTNIIHSEYTLVQEGSQTSVIPEKIINKMKDSLAGYDSNNNPVPDPSLAIQNRTGIEFRPRQGMFVDRLAAVKNFVEYVNNILLTVSAAEEFNLDRLNLIEPLPGGEYYDLAVETFADLDYIVKPIENQLPRYGIVLVKNDETQNSRWSLYRWEQLPESGIPNWIRFRTQSYSVPEYWYYTDWYATDYDPTVKPNYVVQTSNDLLKFVAPPAGSVVKVLNNGRGQFEVYRFTGTGANRDLIGIQDGTIQFSSNLYTNDDPLYEFRLIFDAIRNDIFVKSLQSNFNDLFFYMVNYVLTEQKNVDWIVKTSFITVVHQLRKLEQFANYIKDNQTYYERYINEVKPYRTSLREYLLDYQGDDTFDGDLTDFDLPSIYNRTINKYHSPDGSVSTDSLQVKNLKVYNQWYNNHTLSLKEVTVTNPGNGKTAPIVSLNTVSNVTVAAGDTITQENNTVSGIVTASVTDGNLITIIDTIGNYDLYNYLYINNANSYTTLSSITILADNGYFLEPNVTVVGGGGSGAIARAIVNYETNTIDHFEIVNPGSGYTSTPTILINGVSTGAAGYPLLTGQYYTDSLLIAELTLEFPLGQIDANVYAGNLVIQPETEASGTVYKSTNGNVITLVDVIGTFVAGQYLFTEFANLQIRPAVAVETITLGGNITVNNGDYITQAETGASAIAYGDTNSRILKIWNKTGEFDIQGNLGGDPIGRIKVNNVSSAVGPTYIEEAADTSVTSSYFEFINKSYNKVRTFDQTIKFDRISYDTTVVDWTPNVTITAGQIVRYDNEAYRAVENVYSLSIIKLDSNVTISLGANLYQYSTDVHGTVADPAPIDSDIVYVANVSGQFGRVAVNSISYYGNLAVDGQDITAVPISVTNVFDKTKFELVMANEFGSANDRIWSYYAPTDIMTPRDLSKLIGGIEYPGVQVQSVAFDAVTSKTSGQYLVHTGTSTNSVGVTIDVITELVSDDTSIINFNQLGFDKNQPLVIKEPSIKIVELDNPLLVSAGDTVKQELSGQDQLAHDYEAVIEVSSASSTLTVQQPDGMDLGAEYGNVIVRRFLTTAATLTSSANIQIIVGEVVSQPESGAKGIIEISNVDTNVFHVISITGKFAEGKYLYLDNSNTSVTVTGIVKDSITTVTTTKVKSIAERTNRVIIQNVTDDTLLISGLQNTIDNNKTDVVLEYYNYNDPLYLDTIISSSYGQKYYELSLSGPVNIAYNSIIGQISTYSLTGFVETGVSARLVPTTPASFNTTKIQVTGVPLGKSFDTMGNLVVNGIDSNVYPTGITVVYDSQSSLGIAPEDIDIDGGAYIDTYSSHAPEELIPGHLRDNLNMVVTNDVYTVYLPNIASIYTGNTIGQVGTDLSAECVRLDDGLSTIVIGNIGGFDDRVTVTLSDPIDVNVGDIVLVDTNYSYNGGIVLSKQGSILVLSNTLGYAVGNGYYPVGVMNPGDSSSQIIIYDPETDSFYYQTLPDNITPITVTGVEFVELTVDGNPTGLQLLGVTRRPMTFRIEHTMNSNAQSSIAELQPKYYQYSFNETTLTQDLLITDSNVYVADASLLPNPSPAAGNFGIVYINGEKITYYELDALNNRIGRIRRSVDGTGAPNVHVSGSTVVASDNSLELLGNSHNTTWYNVPTFGLGLGSSDSYQATTLYNNCPAIQVHYGDVR